MFGRPSMTWQAHCEKNKETEAIVVWTRLQMQQCLPGVVAMEERTGKAEKDVVG